MASKRAGPTRCHAPNMYTPSYSFRFESYNFFDPTYALSLPPSLVSASSLLAPPIYPIKGLINKDPYPMQYIGYCTVCNTSNPSHPFNPMASYLDTSPVQAGNPCAMLFSFQFPHFELQNSSLISLTSTEFLSHSPNAPLSQPQLRLHHSLNIHACSLPFPQPRCHRFPHTQLRPINNNKEKTASEISTPKHVHPF